MKKAKSQAKLSFSLSLSQSASGLEIIRGEKPYSENRVLWVILYACISKLVENERNKLFDQNNFFDCRH